MPLHIPQTKTTIPNRGVLQADIVRKS